MTGTPAYGLTRPYTRRPVVEAAIRALPANAPALRSALRTCTCPEVLIHGSRRLLRAGDLAGAHAVAEQLLAHIAPLVTRLVRMVPLPALDREDLGQMVLLAVWQAAWDLGPGKEFWEVHFDSVLRRALRDAADTLRRQQRHTRRFVTGAAPDGSIWQEEAEIPDPTPATGPEDLHVQAALRALPPDLARVCRLKLAGLPVSSSTSTLTVSALLHLPERTVRKRIAAARPYLRDFVGAQAPSAEAADRVA
jgi:DNA-directed RNA polymerase specialized sigma24 family protein